MKKTKILFAINCMNIGGAPSVVFNQIKYLDRERFEPHLLTLYPSKPANFLTQMNFLPKEHQRHFHLRRRSMFDFLTLLAIYRYLKQERFDIVYTHLFLANFLVRALAVLARVPTIIAFEHSTYFNKSRWQIAIDRLLARFTARICVSTDEVKRFTSEQERLPPYLFAVVRNPVSIPQKEEVDVSILRSLADIPEGPTPIFVTVGRFSEEKGQHLLIEAVATLKGKIRDARFILVGHGPREAELNDLVRHHGLENVVHVVHAPERAKEFLHLAGWFILPSLREGQAIVVEEAMLAGLPVIAAKLEGMGEIIKDGETGYFFSPGSVDELAKRITLAIDFPDERDRLVRNVSLVARKTLAPKERVREFEEIVVSSMA